MATKQFMIEIGGVTQDSTNPPGSEFTARDRQYLTFDGTTDELIVLPGFRMPSDYVSGLTAIVQYSMASAVANNVAIRTEVMAIAAGEAITADNFAAIEASADSIVPGTAGLMKEISDALATPTVAADDYVAIVLGRENATTGTNATGDMYIWTLTLEYSDA